MATAPYDEAMIKYLEITLALVSTICAWIAGAAVLIMGVLGGLDVVSDVFLGRPLDATVETTEALLVVAAFMGLGVLHRRRGYIAVDLLRENSPMSVRRFLDCLSLVLMGAYFGLIAWRGWIAAFESLAVREYSNGIFRIPLYPSKFALAIGVTIATLYCALELVKGGLFREIVAPDITRES
jgi:TRAP-type C4-dicarboxylate transport system permease small subunit